MSYTGTGRKATILIEGKTLKQIADEAGLEEHIVRNRYKRNGIRNIAELSKPKSYSRSVFRKVYNVSSSGSRLMEIIYEKDISIHKLAEATGIESSTIYKFLQDGRDISSMRLAKLCAYLGVSMDYIMGLSGDR